MLLDGLDRAKSNFTPNEESTILEFGGKLLLAFSKPSSSIYITPFKN